MVDCGKCYYFREVYFDQCGGVTPAGCEHSDCFKEIKIQNDYGEIVPAKRRTKDIIDFNAEGSCPNFAGFCLKERNGWWKRIFLPPVKVIENG